MLQLHTRREALKRKAQQERDELMQEHLIMNSRELQEMLSATKTKADKISLLKTQIKIRKKTSWTECSYCFYSVQKTTSG